MLLDLFEYLALSGEEGRWIAEISCFCVKLLVLGQESVPLLIVIVICTGIGVK